MGTSRRSEMADHVTIIRSSIIDDVARECGASGLAVYVYLCRRADSSGRSFPSYNTIAEDTGLSRSSAIRYAKLLIEHGYLRQERRTSGALVWVVTSVTMTPPSVTVTPESVTMTPPSVTVTPKVNTTKKKKIDISPTPGFERFWKAYPRRVARAEALKAWAEMGLEDIADRVVNAVEAHKDAGLFSEDEQYVLYPVRWLKYRRFDDELGGSSNRRGGRYLAG